MALLSNILDANGNRRYHGAAMSAELSTCTTVFPVQLTDHGKYATVTTLFHSIDNYHHQFATKTSAKYKIKINKYQKNANSNNHIC